MKVAIIGAGPAGITAGYELTKAGVEVEVFEAGSQVGGLSKTIRLWNQRVDLGPHRFFSNDSRVNKVWFETLGSEYRIINRLTRIYYKGKFFMYPLKPFDALQKLGIIESIKCILSYFREKFFFRKDDNTFESWVIKRFGKRLYKIFFKTYSEKLWGISCKDLDSDFAAQRIKKLSLFEAIKNSFLGDSSKKHKSLLNEFAYPINGSGIVYENMAKFINDHGGKVACNTPVNRVIVEDGIATALEFSDNSLKAYDHIISTMPISLLVERLPKVPEDVKTAASSLKFRNTILVYLNVHATDLFLDNWLYIHSNDLRMGRISNFRNWVPELYGQEKTSILVLEYWAYDNDEIWKDQDDKIIELAKTELSKTGLIKNARISNGKVYRIPKCYPVYQKDYKLNLKPVESYLNSIKSLSVIGRYGAFKYNNQDHSILMGILAAENLTQGKTHDLWDINTDYQNYQES